MRHQFTHFIGFIVFFLASLVLFGQHAPNNRQYFKESKKATIAQSAKNWHLFENLEMAESSSHLLVREDNIWQPERLPNDHLRTVFSHNGRFFVHLSIHPRESIDPVDRELTMTVFNSEKNIIYNISRPHLYDRSLPQLVLSDKDGSLILGENDTGKLWFHDNKGSLNKQVNLFSEASYDLERILIFELSVDGSRVAVLASKRGSAPSGSDAINPDAEPHLILFNSAGRELWRKKLPEFSASAMTISPDGSKILVNNFTVNQSRDIIRRSLVYNDNGEVIFETDLLYKSAHFSRNSNRLILADNQMIRLIDLENNELIWQNKIPRNDGMITQVATTESADISSVLLGENDWSGEYFAFHHPKIMIFNREGMLVQKINFDDQTFRTPAMWISTDGAFLKVGFENKFYMYSAK